MIISVIFMIFYDVFLPLQAIIISRGFNVTAILNATVTMEIILEETFE